MTIHGNGRQRNVLDVEMMFGTSINDDSSKPESPRWSKPSDLPQVVSELNAFHVCWAHFCVPRLPGPFCFFSVLFWVALESNCDDS